MESWYWKFLDTNVFVNVWFEPLWKATSLIFATLLESIFFFKISIKFISILYPTLYLFSLKHVFLVFWSFSGVFIYSVKPVSSHTCRTVGLCEQMALSSPLPSRTLSNAPRITQCVHVLNRVQFYAQLLAPNFLFSHLFPVSCSLYGIYPIFKGTLTPWKWLRS